jgi:hypothetical protein
MVFLPTTAPTGYQASRPWGVPPPATTSPTTRRRDAKRRRPRRLGPRTPRHLSQRRSSATVTVFRLARRRLPQALPLRCRSRSLLSRSLPVPHHVPDIRWPRQDGPPPRDEDESLVGCAPSRIISALQLSASSEQEAWLSVDDRFVHVMAVCAWVEPEAVPLDEVVHEMTHPDVRDGTRRT